MNKFNKVAVTLFILFSANAVQAKIDSNQSGPLTTMTVGASEPVTRGPHQSVGGEPGVGISSIGSGSIISFASLTSPRMSNGEDSNGIYTIQYNDNTPASHREMGVFHFAKITDANVYFGD